MAGVVFSGIKGKRAGAISMEFTGIKELYQQLAPNGPVMEKMIKELTKGMIENVEMTVGGGMREAPIKEGTLRAAGTTDIYVCGKRRTLRKPSPGKTGETGQLLSDQKVGMNEIVGVLGFNLPYALVQEVREDFKHPMGGKAHYSRDNLNERSAANQRNLEEHAKKALA